MGYYITNENGGFESPKSHRPSHEGQEMPKPIEVGPKVAELQQFLLSEKAQEILVSLRMNGMDANPDLEKFILEEETAIDTIDDIKMSNKQKNLLDLKRALLIGVAGDVDYAYDVIFTIGNIAQWSTHDADIEDYASAALEILGL